MCGDKSCFELEKILFKGQRRHRAKLQDFGQRHHSLSRKNKVIDKLSPPISMRYVRSFLTHWAKTSQSIGVSLRISQRLLTLCANSFKSGLNLHLMVII